MALINCSECGKEISDKASSCPNCGAPVIIDAKNNDNSEEKIIAKTNRKINKKVIIGIVSVVVAALICILIIKLFGKKDQLVQLEEIKYLTTREEVQQLFGTPIRYGNESIEVNNMFSDKNYTYSAYCEYYDVWVKGLEGRLYIEYNNSAWTEGQYILQYYELTFAEDESAEEVYDYIIEYLSDKLSKGEHKEKPNTAMGYLNQWETDDKPDSYMGDDFFYRIYFNPRDNKIVWRYEGEYENHRLNMRTDI